MGEGGENKGVAFVNTDLEGDGGMGQGEDRKRGKARGVGETGFIPEFVFPHPALFGEGAVFPMARVCLSSLPKARGHPPPSRTS